MSRATHIFDPDGEVIIILQCLDNPFAPWDDHEEPPAEEPPAEVPPAEGPVIFDEQLEEVCTIVVHSSKWIRKCWQ